jgi:ribosomal-protein-alanine N-acetyltransferase
MVVDYLLKNREYHTPFHQWHDDSYFTTAVQRSYLRSEQRSYFSDTQFCFWLFLKNDHTRIIGKVSFTAIIRGALQSCLVGYHLDQDAAGRGYMSEALQAGCRYMFSEKGLHRIQSDIMPRNTKSIATARRCGFVLQGLNKEYMAINGTWEDHNVYALINDDFQDSSIIL